MNATPAEEFAVKVARPAKYIGPAELRIGPDSATLTARPIRYGGALGVLQSLGYLPVIAGGAYVVYSALVSGDALGFALTVAMVFVAGPALTACGVAIVYGLFGLLRIALRGENTDLTVPLAGITSSTRKGRWVILHASFEPNAGSGLWQLGVRNVEDAKAIESTLAASGA